MLGGYVFPGDRPRPGVYLLEPLLACSLWHLWLWGTRCGMWLLSCTFLVTELDGRPVGCPALRAEFSLEGMAGPSALAHDPPT